MMGLRAIVPARSLFDRNPAHEEADDDDGENGHGQRDPNRQRDHSAPRFSLVSIHEIQAAEQADYDQHQQYYQNYFHRVVGAR